MQLPYFYEPSPSLSPGSLMVLGEDSSRHCIQVLRMREKDRLQVTDGLGNLLTVSLTMADKKGCTVRVEETAFYSVSGRKVCIAISLLKNHSRFEWFLEKATELGVNRILPLLCSRTERQHFRMDRNHNILVAAMLQSRQVWLPQLAEPLRLEQVLESGEYSRKFIAFCSEEDKKSLGEISAGNEVQILIGPEGDFTLEEISTAQNCGFEPVSLGKTRLRTETAGMVSAALLINL